MRCVNCGHDHRAGHPQAKELLRDERGGITHRVMRFDHPNKECFAGTGRGLCGCRSEAAQDVRVDVARELAEGVVPPEDRSDVAEAPGACGRAGRRRPIRGGPWFDVGGSG